MNEKQNSTHKNTKLNLKKYLPSPKRILYEVLGFCISISVIVLILWGYFKLPQKFHDFVQEKYLKTMEIFCIYPIDIREPLTLYRGKSDKPDLEGSVFINAHEGMPVLSCKSGIVKKVWQGKSGLCIKIKHWDGTIAEYGHLQKVFVHKGERVRSGTFLGKVGVVQSPSVSQKISYLEMSFWTAGTPIDPLTILRNRAHKPL